MTRPRDTLISCMAYVGLNPVRVGIISTPEISDHTSLRLPLKGQWFLKLIFQIINK